MLTALLLAGAAPAAPDGAVKLVVLSTRIDRASEKDLAGTVTELVLSALAKGRNVHVVGEADVLPFLDEAAQKQLRIRATAGWDLRPLSGLSVRAGVGAAWTSVTWKDGATRSPLVLELGIGPVF